MGFTISIVTYFILTSLLMPCIPWTKSFGPWTAGPGDNRLDLMRYFISFDKTILIEIIGTLGKPIYSYCLRSFFRDIPITS